MELLACEMAFDASKKGESTQERIDINTTWLSWLTGEVPIPGANLDAMITGRVLWLKKEGVRMDSPIGYQYMPDWDPKPKRWWRRSK